MEQIINLKYVGFGGTGMEYPVYQDDKGKLYFDTNDGRGNLSLYTGAYRDEDGYIYGEPNRHVIEKYKCFSPFKRHKREMDYMMLDRLRLDCEYAIKCNGAEKHLYYGSIEAHIKAMNELYNSFSFEDKPTWITAGMIAKYEKELLQLRKQNALKQKWGNKSMKEMLIHRGYPKAQMFRHASDMYVYVTPLTTEVINEWCDMHGYNREWHCPIFIDNITGKKMYDCAFQWVILGEG